MLQLVGVSDFVSKDPVFDPRMVPKVNAYL